MPHASYILQQQEFMYSINMGNGYVRKDKDSVINFRMLTVPHRKSFHTGINKLRQTGLLLKETISSGKT
jgi:hypothetical protein